MNNYDEQHSQRQELSGIGPVNARVKLTLITGGIIDQAADNQEVMTMRDAFNSSYPAGPAVRNVVQQPQTNVEALPVREISIAPDGSMTTPEIPSKQPVMNNVVSLEAYRAEKDRLIEEARGLIQDTPDYDNNGAYIDAIS